MLIHPSLVFGANVEDNYPVGIVSFRRHVMECYEQFGMVDEKCTLSIEY